MQYRLPHLGKVCLAHVDAAVHGHRHSIHWVALLVLVRAPVEGIVKGRGVVSGVVVVKKRGIGERGRGSDQYWGGWPQP
jgi:hypothetical protein